MNHQWFNERWTNISHTLLKYSPWYWASTNISYINPHKLSWALSQILPIISHISSNLNSPQINTHHITTKIGSQNYIIPIQGSTSFSLWAKPRESPNSLKSHYDVANSKSHYDVAKSKLAMMQHYLQSPLLRSISKARCYTAPLKPVTTRHF